MQKSNETTGALSSTEMVERVASRISALMGGKFGEGFFRDDAIDIARAAVEAMREPTKQMVEQAYINVHTTIESIAGELTAEQQIAELHRAMIDAALGK